MQAQLLITGFFQPTFCRLPFSKRLFVGYIFQNFVCECWQFLQVCRHNSSSLGLGHSVSDPRSRTHGRGLVVSDSRPRTHGLGPPVLSSCFIRTCGTRLATKEFQCVTVVGPAAGRNTKPRTETEHQAHDSLDCGLAFNGRSGIFPEVYTRRNSHKTHGTSFK